MRVYIVLKLCYGDFCGVCLVSADKESAEKYCKEMNRKSRDCEYRIVGKNLKGLEQ